MATVSDETKKALEGARAEIIANKTLRPRDDYNKGFNAGIDEAIKFLNHYVKGEGLFQA